MSSAIAVVLAAGKGTRMKSDLPKVLVEASGRPLVDYVLDAVRQAGVHEALVVVGYKADLVRETLGGQEGIRFVDQTEQLGTGHAVQVCCEHLKGREGAVLVLTGDSPMTQASSLKSLLDLYHAERPACVLGTLIKEDPTGLGRIVRDQAGEFVGIVEQKDASPTEQAIQEVNMSTYVFDAPALLRTLGKLQNDNRQGEYYITDCPGILRREGADVRALPVLKACEALSVNTVDDLAVVESALEQQAGKN